MGMLGKYHETILLPRNFVQPGRYVVVKVEDRVEHLARLAKPRPGRDGIEREEEVDEEERDGDAGVETTEEEGREEN